jgi:teichuronic acid biosynthesis glycosyltransferase TuaC
MRIAFLCKRRYMGKDVIDDRYARLYEIPFQLAELGHEVLGLCLSYYRDGDGEWRHTTRAGSLRWVSCSLGNSILPALLAYPRRALAIVRDHAPDIVIGASDIPHVVLGEWIARRLRLPFVAELYDNFESFGLARIPGSVTAYRHAVRKAALVSCTSDILANHVRDVYRAPGKILALPSAVDSVTFRIRDQATCRHNLGLPEQGRLIGTAGGLHADRGIGTLYQAFNRLAVEDQHVHLVLAGPVDSRMPPPKGPQVHYLGELPHAQIAELFGCLDVGVIYLRDTPFGRFCFPQKAYEMAACGIPFVAADVGAMRSLLMNSPECLYRPDDADSLAAALRGQLSSPRPNGVVPKDWRQLVADLNDALVALEVPAMVSARTRL